MMKIGRSLSYLVGVVPRNKLEKGKNVVKFHALSRRANLTGSITGRRPAEITLFYKFCTYVFKGYKLTRGQFWLVPVGKAALTTLLTQYAVFARDTYYKSPIQLYQRKDKVHKLPYSFGLGNLPLWIKRCGQSSARFISVKLLAFWKLIGCRTDHTYTCGAGARTCMQHPGY